MLCMHTIQAYFKSPLAETDVGNYPTLSLMKNLQQLQMLKGEIETTLEILQPIGELSSYHMIMGQSLNID